MMDRMTINSIKHRVRELARHNLEGTVRMYTGDLITGTFTWDGTNKFRVDTPQAAIFFRYDEVEWVD